MPTFTGMFFITVVFFLVARVQEVLVWWGWGPSRVPPAASSRAPPRSVIAPTISQTLPVGWKVLQKKEPIHLDNWFAQPFMMCSSLPTFDNSLEERQSLSTLIACQSEQACSHLKDHESFITSMYSQLSNKSTGTMEKNYQNLLRYSLFLAVLLEWIQDFYLWYFYFSGTIE